MSDHGANVHAVYGADVNGRDASERRAGCALKTNDLHDCVLRVHGNVRVHDHGGHGQMLPFPRYLPPVQAY